VPARTRHRDPAPLSIAQLSALVAAAARELVWGLRLVRATVEEWRGRALAIPDPVMRRNALAALGDKRPLLDGAALFWILPTRRQPDLVRLLVSFQLLANLHDHAGERAGRGSSPEPAGSIAAIGAIIDSTRPWPGYFGQQPAPDGGYLDALADACRTATARLPHYAAARPALIQQTRCAQIMDIEHHMAGPDRARRLKRFATDKLSNKTTDVEWWELAAGAASMMTVIVTLALAADERTTSGDIERAVDAYILVGSVGSLLDNYIDQDDDAATGTHNFMNYYATREQGQHRLAVLIERALREVGTLRRGKHHLVIVASMTAMYLTTDSAGSETLRASTDALAARGGSLTQLLIPMMRVWRSVYEQADA
jgi:tetraprenyl-beta-curcumene synthase